MSTTGPSPVAIGIESGWIAARWAAPTHVRAGISTRLLPGQSTGPYARGNLGDHVGDDPAAVAANRRLLREVLALPQEPAWLRQVHGCAVLAPGETAPEEADAAITRTPGTVLAILTADCLPILLCNAEGTEIAAIHAGWRGLAGGVIDATVGRMVSAAGSLRAWIGPGIGPEAFEVGDDVRAAMLDAAGPEDRNAVLAAFVPRRAAEGIIAGKWWCDLPRLAVIRLARLGVRQVASSGLCTVSDARFYSHRRDRVTGRMASLVWIAGQRD